MAELVQFELEKFNVLIQIKTLDKWGLYGLTVLPETRSGRQGITKKERYTDVISDLVQLGVHESVINEATEYFAFGTDYVIEGLEVLAKAFDKLRNQTSAEK